MQRLAIGITFLLGLVVSATTSADDEPASRWVTLGTVAGPNLTSERGQPSNALVVGRDIYVVDAGDGTATRLGKAGYSLRQVRAVIISHLHYDHIGGLGGILGIRYQVSAPGVLTIIGPPGTQRLVDGLVESMIPSAEVGAGVPGEPFRNPAEGVTVIEVVDGMTLDLDVMQLKVARNTHYSFAANTPEWEKFQSLAYRFDLPDRSIAFTGDTGPSRSVGDLAKGVDLLVSEMMDVDVAVKQVRSRNPHFTDDDIRRIETHLRSHHVTPEQVGELASRAQARRVVITHMSPATLTAAELDAYIERIQAIYDGPAVIADDLDEF